MKMNLKNYSIQTPKLPRLRFSPTAWAKLLFLRDAGDTEIGGFGLALADDLLYVEDVRLVRQHGTAVHVEFEDQSVADFFDDQVDAGRQPEQFGRIWIHTHPGSSAEPSSTDEATFERVFGGAGWAVMFILARGGQTYARLRFNVGPGGEQLIPVEVDFSREFAGSAREEWQAEYKAHVVPRLPKQDLVTDLPVRHLAGSDDELSESWWREAWGDYHDFDQLPVEEPYGYVRDF